MKLIPLTQGKVAKVDDADYLWLSQWKWFAHSPRAGLFYAKRNSSGEETKGKTIHMHREILKLMGVKKADHKDGNGLNNQRRNLRPATNSQNLANRSKQRNNTSGFKGVTWDALTRKWRAQIRVKKKHIYLGIFDLPRWAALAYDSAARQYFGPFAYFNFP